MTQEAVSSTVGGYDQILPLGGDVQINRAQPKYALYPVWLLNTTWKDKQYTFAMNGQTGKFVGDLPSDKGKAWAIFFAVTAAVTVISYLIGMLLK